MISQIKPNNLYKIFLLDETSINKKKKNEMLKGMSPTFTINDTITKLLRQIFGQDFLSNKPSLLLIGNWVGNERSINIESPSKERLIGSQAFSMHKLDSFEKTNHVYIFSLLLSHLACCASHYFNYQDGISTPKKWKIKMRGITGW